VFHPADSQYVFFLAAYETFSKIDHIIGHKVSLSKYKMVGITPCNLSYHNRIEVSRKETTENIQTHGD
jgi:hypothetical protein